MFILTATTLMAAGKETIKVEEIVVTATRYEEKLSSVPANVTVITEEDIKNSTAQNIPDLLRTEVGIHVNDIAGNRRNITVDIRGFGETATLNTLVLVDGRRVNQADLSGTDWTQIPLDRVKKIEIIRGGRGSILYGDNASGGVINIITKEGDLLKAGVGVTAGSYDTFKGTAYLSGSSNNLLYSLSGSYLSSDGYRDNSNTETKDLGVNLGYHLSNFIKLNFSSGYHKDNTGLPGALKESDFAAGVSRTDSTNPNDFVKVEDYYFKGGSKFYFLDDSLAKVDISFRKRDFLAFSTFAGGEFLGNSEIKTLALSPQVLLRNEIKEMKNTLTIGFDYQGVEESILNDVLFFGSRAKEEFKLEKESYGYYIHDEINVTDNILLSSGYRYDRADFTFRPSTPDQTTMDEDLFTAGINYNFYKKSYVYFSFSKSFRYPVLDELFSFFTNTIDTRLIPQRSDDYEFGIRHYFTNAIYVHVNFFRTDTDNEIFFNPITFANENLDGTMRRDGVEISFSTQPFEWLILNGTYTYLDATIKGDLFEENDIPNVPNHKASLGTIFSLGRGFSVALNGVYIGERPFVSDFANNFGDQEDYIVINSKLKYQWKSLTAFLDINNLTNEEYSEYGVLGGFPVEKAFYPSPKRNFLIGLSVDF
jgi:iron complex outermembrane receptor protein